MATKNKYNKAYDEGYNDGKKADLMDHFVHNLKVPFKWEDQKEYDSYNAGFNDGSSDKHDDNDSNYSGGTSESSGK